MIELNFDDDYRNDEVTKQMSQLLLKGWTMLSENCSRCSEVPLMRSKDGRSFCCKCSSFTDAMNKNKATEEFINNDLFNRMIDAYKPFGQIPLNGDKLNSIHNNNHKIVPGDVEPCATESAKFDSTFEINQLRLLEIQINKSLFRYSVILNSITGDVDLDS